MRPQSQPSRKVPTCLHFPHFPGPILCAPALKGKPFLMQYLQYRFVLVSQDRDCVYLTFAELGEHYLRYIVEGEDWADHLPNSFLHLVEHGPWIVTNRQHMEQLGQVMEGIRLRAEEDTHQDRVAGIML
ncbi:hypothetical protein F5884DRAFT_790546 [Xylogone sp. PMI_703]|nr:hypothetical protein F5884DRAFT_790546 [Xylogone sp. PMI_703]